MENRYVAPALGRFLGFIGFMMGLVFFHLVNQYMDLGIKMIGFESLGWKGWVLLGVSIVVGLFFMIVGWGIAVQIPVRSDKTNYLISSLWHFFANGMMLWVVLWGFLLQIKIGPNAKEIVYSWIKQMGTLAAFWHCFGWGFIACLVVGFVSSTASDFAKMFVISVVVFLIGAYLESQAYNMHSHGWISVGFITGVGSFFLSGLMIQKDANEREKIKTM